MPEQHFDLLLAEVLPLGSLFAVGGRVRDELRAEGRGLRSIPKDSDYVVCGLSFEDLEQRLSQLGKVDRVGAMFAVIKLTREGQTVDVALPRREHSTGIGHRDFVIQSGPEVALVDDLARRDFRMNMIARAIPSGELIDPYDGRADIIARRIDILHEETFEEDPLRMLRACQFAARFSFDLTPRTFVAMQHSAHLIASISPQRIGEELSKFLLNAHRPSIAIELMRETGLLKVIWPELLEGLGVEQNEWHAYDVYRHNLATIDALPPGDLILRLAALLHDVGKPRVKDGPHFYRHEYVGEDLARAMLARAAFSNEVCDQVCALVRHHMYQADPSMSDAALRRFLRRVGIAQLDGLFALRQADILASGLPKRDDANERFQMRVAAEVLAKPALSIKDLKINGHEIIAAFQKHGFEIASRGDRRVGDIMHWMLEQVLDQPALNTVEHLNELLEQALNAHREGSFHVQRRL